MKEQNSTMAAKRELNNVLKEEYKSFSVLKKVLEAKRESEAMKDFLNAANLTFENLVDIDYFKKQLTFATFTASNGTTFEAIARKGKDGEMKQAKWSFWLILTAATKQRKEELKRELKAKEESIKAMEVEEKKQQEKQTKKSK